MDSARQSFTIIDQDLLAQAKRSLDQDFINAEVFKGKVADFLKSKGVTLTKYIRLEVGQA